MFKLSDIFGQDSAIDAIRRMYLAERLPHGLLFAGPTGVGKATTAKALAELFLCEKPHDDAPCGKCAACRVFEAGNHPDYHVITKELIRLHDKSGESKATELSIDVIRHELVGPAGLKASMGRGKVFVIEQADLMNIAAQNAALKTLEEPAGRSLIVLLAEQPLALLPTIRSRCQAVRFSPLSDERVVSELKKRGIGDADAADAAMLAEGSLGQALRWMEDGVIVRARELRQRLKEMLMGRAVADLPDWFKTASEEYAAKQLERDELSSKTQATRDGMTLYLRIAAQAFRRRLARIDDDPAEMERCCAAIDAIARAEQYLDANVTISLIFQQLAVRLESLFARSVSSAGRGPG